MLLTPALIPPSPDFWVDAANALLQAVRRGDMGDVADHDLSGLCVMMQTYEHAILLKNAIAQTLQTTFIPPRITTLETWLTTLVPDASEPQNARQSVRLMFFYEQLRTHAWLKKLFGAKRNTDLLPLAKTLLSLSDELTKAMLPLLDTSPAMVDAAWQNALDNLSPQAQTILSQEAQLVCALWRGQLDQFDAIILRFRQMLRFAQNASMPLVWVSPTTPDAQEQIFLDTYAKTHMVLPIVLNWPAKKIPSILARAWPEIISDGTQQDGTIEALAGVSVYNASGLEDEAMHGAQTIIDWLAQGKMRLAIVAQDRLVARRIRALLQRAQVSVCDETGWKLSTTRAAAALSAWFLLVSSGASTKALLDFLKSPFVLSAADNKSDQLMTIERIIGRNNIIAGWDNLSFYLASTPIEQETIGHLAAQAKLFSGRHTLGGWLTHTIDALAALDVASAFSADAAGVQILDLLARLQKECADVDGVFTLTEWCAFIHMQLEDAAFIANNTDRRVIMLPLNGARLRTFDAVIVVGVGADNLPSKHIETLFFANAVRRELGLITRESRQQQQLRDFAEIFCTNKEVVLSWQAHCDGESRAVSPWLMRLNLKLASHQLPTLSEHQITLATEKLNYAPAMMPAPSAGQLIPATISASGFNTLIACPYQFFATRMLGLLVEDSASEEIDKRDYGKWCHLILKTYHDALAESPINYDIRLPMLAKISDEVFNKMIDRYPAALAYHVRWHNTMPAYIAWANQYEQEGWTFVLGEQAYEKTLSWDDGSIMLKGRIDRIDQHSDGRYAVIDYKTANEKSLNNKLNSGEDQQLAFYGLLADTVIDEASYVSLNVNKNAIKQIAAEEYPSWQKTLEKNIITMMQSIAHGAPLPANGVQSVCQYCDVRGLCRKGVW